MKFIDDTLLKEVISIREASYTLENPLTEEEKNIAIERIKNDYENSKSRIAEFRQEFISNSLILQKMRNSKKTENILDVVDDIKKQANSYEDDYIYLTHMIYQTTKDETSLRVNIETMGQELMMLGDQLNMISGKSSTYEEIKNITLQIAEKRLKIDGAVKEVHILSIMNAYYQRLSREIVMGNIKLVYK